MMMWSGIDKRRFPRANYKCLIHIRRLISDHTITTKTENIGVGGVCVILKEGLDIFSNVELELILDDGMETVRCNGSVVWVVKEKYPDGDMYDTGIEFLDLSPQNRSRIEKVVEHILASEGENSAA